MKILACRARASLAAAIVLTAIGLLTPLFSTGVRTQTTGRQFYVAPNGSPSNDGSQARPLDLATALGGASPARAGDTIWLRGGTYVGNFSSHLTGSPSAPIVVRQYPGERATIDANTSNRTAPGLAVSGADAWYWGFEVTDSNPQRVNTQRGNSIDVYGPRTKFINMIVHDGLQGFGLWTPAIDAEIYGSLIYNVGTEGPDRGHGHSIYTQNLTGIKQITDNILFNGFSFGIHGYTEGGAIDNFRFEGNVAFNHGLLSATSGAKANMLLGGSKVAHDAVIVDNYSYYSPGVGGRGFDIGYVTPCDRPTVQGNYVAGGTPLQLNCTNAVVASNTFYGSIPSSLPTAYPSNTFLTTRPTGVVVDVRPNRYEPGRGHVIIYNWAGLSSVDVDLSPLGLQAGEGFEIRDAQNFFGPAVVAGSYSGAPVDVPLTGLTVVRPVGNAPRQVPHTAPEFGVFIVLRTSQSGPSVPTGSLSVSPGSVSPGQAATLTWSTLNATSVRIDPGVGIVAASGSHAVTPSSTTTYTLTASNVAGSLTRSVAVNVVPNAPPTVSLTPSGMSFTAPATIGLTATAIDSNGTIAQVAFYSGSTLLATDTTSPHGYNWSNVPAGTYTLTARATDNLGATTTSAPVTVTVTTLGGGGGGSTTAAFVRTDTATQGSWRGVYGTEGYSLAFDGTALPSYAQMALSGQAAWQWEGNPTDARALQRAAGTGRLAATWYAGTSFTIDVAITDGRSHRVAFYALDWANERRTQTVEVRDAATNALLDSRTMTEFRGGQYWVWQVSGRVSFRFTRTQGPNATISGVFFDPTDGGGTSPE